MDFKRDVFKKWSGAHIVQTCVKCGIVFWANITDDDYICTRCREANTEYEYCDLCDVEFKVVEDEPNRHLCESCYAGLEYQAESLKKEN